MTTTYGSDVVIDVLRELDIEVAAINPGASFRGMHASLAHSGNPELVLSLHENVAVAAAHGYAKSAGRPMAVFLHNLVGLQSGSMGIFNAWADQAPMLVIGGSGPADAAHRRPWIDWVHSARLQSLVVRDYLKWDDQPVSLAALPESLGRAYEIASSVPHGPTYVSVDTGLQEKEMTKEEWAACRATTTAVTSANGPRTTITVPEDTLDQVADLLVRAERPVILADYTGRSEAGYDALKLLAEALACPVVDLMARHNLDNGHWADCTTLREEVLADADVVLCLDLRDLNHGLGKTVHETHDHQPLVRPDARIVSISTNQLLLRGFIDYSGPNPQVWDILADTASCLPALVGMVGDRVGDRSARREELTQRTEGVRERRIRPVDLDADATTDSLSRLVHEAVAMSGPWELANGHMRGAVRARWELSGFNAQLGQNVGAGLGYGMGVSIGAALAHRGDDTMIVNLQNDGDLLYAPSALWTAARYELPVLTVMVNNRTYGQDRMHQTLMAKARGYALETASVGIDIDNPEVDFAGLARAQGVEAWGPLTTNDEVQAALARGTKIVRDERRPVLIDVVVPR